MRPRNSIVRQPAIVTRKPSVVRAASPWTAALAPRSSSRATIAAHPSPLDAAQVIGKAAYEKGAEAASSGVASGLRFMQFLRAYIRAFAAGVGSYLLLSELAAGHFNPLAIIATHLLMFIAAPFYALVLAPTLFAAYRLAAQTQIPAHLRAYIPAMLFGVLLMVQRIGSGQFLLAGNYRADLTAVAALVAGAIAGYTFNREVAKLRPAMSA